MSQEVENEPDTGLGQSGIAPTAIQLRFSIYSYVRVRNQVENLRIHSISISVSSVLASKAYL